MGTIRLRRLSRDRSRTPPHPSHLPCVLRGRVVDARSGDPVAGARAALAEPLELLALLRPPPLSRRRTAVADADGRFELAAPSRGNTWLLVHCPGWLPELVELPGGEREARVALSRPGSLRGRLLGADGAPVAGARLRALCPASVDAADAVSAPDGTFRLDGLRPGRWLVAPDGARPAGEVAAAVADVAAGEAALVVLRPRRCATGALC